MQGVDQTRNQKGGGERERPTRRHVYMNMNHHHNSGLG